MGKSSERKFTNVFEKRAREIQEHKREDETLFSDYYIERARKRVHRYKTLRAPYISPSWLQKFFDINRRQKIDSVDRNFIKLHIIGSGNESKVISALLFLQLLDNDLNATPKLASLRAMGDEFRDNLKSVIEDAYSDLVSTVILDVSKPSDLVNFFIQRYDFSQKLALDCTKLFVWLASSSNFAISQELRDFVHVHAPRAGSTTRKKTIAPTKQSVLRSQKRRAYKKTIQSQDLELDESFATLKFDEFIFAVKRDISSIDFARRQVNEMLDYLKYRLKKEDK